ncbi:MAG: glycosyltransferase family 2 protein [Prevotella sp.]|nr:glycosyltransferase family 2 protein [Prevotella sp.]
MKIYAVIVTYNRLPLLKECIETVRQQSSQLHEIVIVDNNSTDGTHEYLEGIKTDGFSIVHLPENIGGAGGFSCGIKTAVEHGADAVWVMDDDTIPEPDALQKLYDVIVQNPNAGYASSRVLWTDGTDHNMNIPVFCSTSDSTSSVRKLKQSSFVSMLITAKAICTVGLPYKEFFIWKDDTEYSSRIVNSGFDGLFVADSVVLHKTAVNYNADLSTAPVSQAWKFYYWKRNSIFMSKMRYGKGMKFYIKELNHMRIAYMKLLRRPKVERNIFWNKIKEGYHDGLSFAPKIEMINRETV